MLNERRCLLESSVISVGYSDLAIVQSSESVPILSDSRVPQPGWGVKRELVLRW
jgi:hypothetical protein